jgi:hypothetical protein
MTRDVKEKYQEMCDTECNARPNLVTFFNKLQRYHTTFPLHVTLPPASR